MSRSAAAPARLASTFAWSNRIVPAAATAAAAVVDRFAGDVAGVAVATVDATSGRTSTTAKVQYVNSSQVIPYIALGFAATYDDGTKELWWVYKCQCSEITRDMKTEEGDNVEYNTPTLEAVAMPLLNNGNLAAVCDTNVVTTASIASGWFSAVFLADPA